MGLDKLDRRIPLIELGPRGQSERFEESVGGAVGSEIKALCA